MKTPLLLAAVGVALAAASPAAAKEPLSATICGASGCKKVTDRALLNEIPAGETTVALGAVAPYYRVTIVADGPKGESHSFSVYYVPTAKAMAWAEQGVVRLHPIYGDVANGVMRKLAAGIEPFSTPRVPSVVVGDRRITGAAAQTYLSLFAPGNEAAPLVASPSDWVDIDLRSPRGSPWTDGTPDLAYAPSENLVQQGGRRFELAESLASDIEAGRALDPNDRSSSTARLGAGIGGGVLLLGLGLILVRRARG